MLEKKLYEHLAKIATAPYLFIGSGMSRRYLKTETWHGLLIKMVELLSLPKQYEYYLANAENDLPMAASLMGKDFNEKWWSDDKYTVSRTSYSGSTTSKYSPIKYEVCQYLIGRGASPSPQWLAETDLLKTINIDGVITTNWDTLLEELFPSHTVYIGQEQLIFSDIMAIGEIYKIHGCVSDPESLLLTREDYDGFRERNTYLAAKLLTIFMEHPIIFLGYSLEDANIQDILKSIIKCLKRENVEKLRDRLIFCRWKEDIAQSTMTESTMYISDTIIPIQLIEISDYTEVYGALARNKRKLPVKVLRHVKHMLYDFVKSAKPEGNVVVTDDIDKLEKTSDVEFVFGVGLKEKLSEYGLKGVTLVDLYEDIIVPRGWDPMQIAKDVLPQFERGYFPAFKYLRNAGLLRENGELVWGEVPGFSKDFVKKINERKVKTFYPQKEYAVKEPTINATYSTLADLIAKNDWMHILMYTPLLEESKIDLDVLHQFLKENKDKIRDDTYSTQFRKLINIYDMLMYKML